MFSIDKEKFGTFVAQLRREKGLMQKDLAEKLYVSDKAVSKWERGLSIPDVSLLMPLAELLGVTVTELLECRRIPQAEPLDAKQTEVLVQKVIGMTGEENRGSRKKHGKWLLACSLLGGLELWLLTLAGISWEEITVSLGTVMLLMVVFGLYFCIFARERLPDYYDENRISSISDGFLRMNVPGVCFNNNNWPYILKAGRLWCLLGLALMPAVYYVFRRLTLESWHGSWIYISLFLVLGGLFLPMVVVGRKYEFGGEQLRPVKKSWRDFAWIGILVPVLLIALHSGAVGSGSGLKVGWSERSGADFWSASYAYYHGWRERTINWGGDAAVLYAEVSTESGELGLTVTDENGNVLFLEESMNGCAEIPLSGKAKVRIRGDGHKGSFFIRCQ